MNLADLASEFPRDKIEWRAQMVSNDGRRAMALAYIDARDVMERLDEVCGQSGWQTEHVDCGGGRLGCKIGIFVGSTGWVWKSDGAGNTDIEGEKGAFSSALKRAAVAWGIGRYLYDMPAPWVPCESYKDNRDKWKFKKFTADPWSFVTPAKGAQAPEGPRGGQDKKPPTKSEIKLYGYPENGTKKTKTYRRNITGVASFIDDLEITVQADPFAWDTNAEGVGIARLGIDKVGRADLRDRLDNLEIQAADLARNLHAG